MPNVCGCSISTKNGHPCPTHGFAEKLDQAARELVVAVDQGTGVNATKKRIQDLFDEMKAARGAWKK